jgi:hypothetical protein
MKTHGLPSICLGPTGNRQGTYNFLSLVSGLVMKRRTWDELPVPQSVIDRLSKLASNSGVSKDLIFANQNHQSYHWPDNPPDSLDDTPIGAYPDLPAEHPGILLDCSPPGVPPPVDTTNNDQEDWAALADAAIDNADLDVTPPIPQDIVDLSSNDDDIPSPLPSSLRQTLEYIPKLESTSLPVTPPPSNHPRSRYPSRARAPPKHLTEYHLYTTVADESKQPPSYPYRNATGVDVDLAMKDEILMAHICHYVMTHTADKLFHTTQPPKKQFGLQEGLRLFGTECEIAIHKELTQFHTLKCFAPKDPKHLSRTERRNALSSLMFITEKKDGEIKARTCANGSTQRQHIAKD